MDYLYFFGLVSRIFYKEIIFRVLSFILMIDKLYKLYFFFFTIKWLNGIIVSVKGV